MNEAVMPEPPGERTRKMRSPAERRLARMRFLSRLLDNAIALPGGYRVGLDPLIGLLPGVGDFLGATLSMWLIYDAARLGISKRTLARMGLNVIIDTTAGTVPVVGDLMDAVWKSNQRNMQLVETEYHGALPPRSFKRIGLTFLIILAAVYAIILAVVFLVLKGILSLFGFW